MTDSKSIALRAQAETLIQNHPALAFHISQMMKQSNPETPPTPIGGLTAKQSELLEFIRSYARTRNGVPPSYAEMCDAVGLKSKSGIHRIIVALEERGYLTRLPNRARAIYLPEAA